MTTEIFSGCIERQKYSTSSEADSCFANASLRIDRKRTDCNTSL